MTDKTKYALTAGFVAVLFAAVIYLLPAKEIAIELIAHIRSYGSIAPAVFFCVFVAAAVMGFSRSVLTIIGGILFEPLLAVLVVLLSTMVSFACTFMLAKNFAADWVAARLEKIPASKTMMAAVEQHGFRMLVLMRLNPFVPGIVNGYGFGMTSIRFVPYLAASLLGSLPLTLIYVYLGWAGGQSILRADAEPASLQSGTLLFGVILSVAMLIGIAWYGRRATAMTAIDEPRSGTQ